MCLTWNDITCIPKEATQEREKENNMTEKNEHKMNEKSEKKNY